MLCSGGAGRDLVRVRVKVRVRVYRARGRVRVRVRVRVRARVRVWPGETVASMTVRALPTKASRSTWLEKARG